MHSSGDLLPMEQLFLTPGLFSWPFPATHISVTRNKTLPAQNLFQTQGNYGYGNSSSTTSSSLPLSFAVHSPGAAWLYSCTRLPEGTLGSPAGESSVYWAYPIENHRRGLGAGWGGGMWLGRKSKENVVLVFVRTVHCPGEWCRWTSLLLAAKWEPKSKNAVSDTQGSKHLSTSGLGFGRKAEIPVANSCSVVLYSITDLLTRFCLPDWSLERSSL